MTLGLCFWVIMLVWLVFGILAYAGMVGTYGVAGNTILLFILFGLLGWQLFGPPLHR